MAATSPAKRRSKKTTSTRTQNKQNIASFRKLHFSFQGRHHDSPVNHPLFRWWLMAARRTPSWHGMCCPDRRRHRRTQRRRRPPACPPSPTRGIYAKCSAAARSMRPIDDFFYFNSTAECEPRECDAAPLAWTVPDAIAARAPVRVPANGRDKTNRYPRKMPDRPPYRDDRLGTSSRFGYR